MTGWFELRRSPSLTAALIVCALALAACGDDGSSDSSATDTTTLEPEQIAQAIADCTTNAGLEGEVVDGEDPQSVGIDLTTETATIVVRVFPSPEEAAAYQSDSGLDQEQAGNVVILGGAIPAKAHDLIISCLPASD